jgi:hypothetical protein
MVLIVPEGPPRVARGWTGLRDGEGRFHGAAVERPRLSLESARLRRVSGEEKPRPFRSCVSPPSIGLVSDS